MPHHNDFSRQSTLPPHLYCKAIIPKVSRTFAISIRILRGDFHKSVLCSYLLCRILDTVEDSSFPDFAHQETVFNSFTELFSREDFSDRAIQSWLELFFTTALLRQDEGDYYDLLRNTDLVIANFLTLPGNYRKVIKDCIIEMSRGMLSMVSKRQQSSTPFFLKTEADLDKYCYFVAGTVGVLTARLLREYSGRINHSLFNYLEEKSVSFGLGLQMTNILKDCWADYQRGLCYIPETMISKHNLSAAGFFEPQNLKKAQKTIDDLITLAAGHLDDGLDLILSIPRSQFRVKLSCLWPLFFAITTLIETKRNRKLLLGEVVKISRARVQKLMRKTTLLGWNNRSIGNYYESFRVLL